MTVNYREIYVREDTETVCLPPTGILIGIVISIANQPMNYSWEVTDVNFAALYADDVWYVGDNDSGHYWKEGLPNSDTRKPYYVRFIGEHPDVRIRMFSEWP